MAFHGGAVFAVGAPCGSQGGAMYDPPSHDPSRLPAGPNCWLMFGPSVSIGSSYMSVMQGFQHVNMVFNTSGGGGGSVPTPVGLPGPVEA
jgi:hypothetical protein